MSDVTGAGPGRCPQCDGPLEVGAIFGSPVLAWGHGDERPGRWGTIVGAERLGRMTPTRSASIPAIRCTTCQTGTFSY